LCEGGRWWEVWRGEPKPRLLSTPLVARKFRKKFVLLSQIFSVNLREKSPKFFVFMSRLF
jgi:hypothetical protein